MESSELLEGCPVCGCDGATFMKLSRGDQFKLSCPNCSTHTFERAAWKRLPFSGGLDQDRRTLLAYRICKTQPDQVIGAADLEALASAGSPPDAAECLDNLLIYLARAQRPGEPSHVQPRLLTAAIGVGGDDAAEWVFREAHSAGWVRLDPDHFSAGHTIAATLTAQGWERHRQLIRNATGSRHAFMAMDFKHHDIRSLFNDHLVPGVARTGFELRTTEHAKKTAGLIDARMRVELHTSRFVVCDLTHNNRGAYWEAGFAEGIGRPVFYLCRTDVLDSQDPESKPHFDIAHQAIVKWDPSNPGAAVDELVAMIRATLPGEAKMED